MSTLHAKATKIQLLLKIRRQRQELSIEKQRWMLATAQYDRGWNTLISLRKYFIAGSSIVALYNIRHPSRLVRWTKRALGLLGTYKVLRKTLRLP